MLQRWLVQQPYLTWSMEPQKTSGDAADAHLRDYRGSTRTANACALDPAPSSTRTGKMNSETARIDCAEHHKQAQGPVEMRPNTTKETFHTGSSHHTPAVLGVCSPHHGRRSCVSRTALPVASSPRSGPRHPPRPRARRGRRPPPPLIAPKPKEGATSKPPKAPPKPPQLAAIRRSGIRHQSDGAPTGRRRPVPRTTSPRTRQTHR